MEQSRIKVRVADSHRDQLDEVRAKLEHAGMAVGEVLPTIGIISGSCDPTQLDSLRQVPGVAKVSRLQEFHVPPPESDVQ